MKSDLSLLVVLALGLFCSSGAVPARAADELRVEFLSMNGHARKITYKVSSAEASRLEAFPMAVDPHLTRARQDYAAQLGYSEKQFGSDVWKIVPGLRVSRVSLRHSGGRVTDLRLR